MEPLPSSISVIDESRIGKQLKINFKEDAQNMPLAKIPPAPSSLDEHLDKMLLDGKYRTSFKQMEMLGAGGFGMVYKVKHYLEKQFYAVKIV